MDDSISLVLASNNIIVLQQNSYSFHQSAIQSASQNVAQKSDNLGMEKGHATILLATTI